MNRVRSRSAEIRAWLWAGVIAGLIFSASSRSTVAGPSVPQFDKVAHFSVYGLLATLVYRALRGRAGAWWALVAVSAYGATDEWHQYFVPGRSSEIADWVADTAGAAVAIFIYHRWSAYRRLLETPLTTRSPGAADAADGGRAGGMPGTPATPAARKDVP